LITTPPRPGAGALPWHLRTIAARNVPLYDYLGFNIVHETQLPRSGLPHWYMVRPAHTDTALV
jgi:hypothetical protein